MTLRALIALEERERINSLRERGRWLDLFRILREALWNKYGATADEQAWKESLGVHPADVPPPGELTDKERELAAYIFSSGLIKLPTTPES